MKKSELLFFVQERLAHRNVSTDVYQNYGYERLFQAQFSSTQSCQKDELEQPKVNNSFQNWRMTAQKSLIQISLTGIQTDRAEAFGQVDDLCLAEFAACYYEDYKPIEDRHNDNQPVVLTDQILENQHSSSQILPTKISLMTKKETMKCRKVKAVIRFHKPRKATDPEKYFHHVLMLYFPWREESDLIGPNGTYASKLHDPLMRQTVNRNQTSFEPYGEAVEEALEYIQDNLQYSLYGERFDAFAEQENCEIHEELLNPISDNHSHMNDDEILPELSSGQNAQTTFPVLSSFQPSQTDDGNLLSLV